MAQEEVSSRGLDVRRGDGVGGSGDGGGDNSGATSCTKPSGGIGSGGIRSSSISSLDRSSDCGIGAVGGRVIGVGGFGAAASVACGRKQSAAKSGPLATTFSSSSHYLASSARHLTRDLAGCLRNKLVCFWTMFTKRKKEEDLDESLFTAIHYRPEELGVLEKSTKFTRKEIQLIYRGFKQECPSGMVDEHAFKEIFAQFFPQGDATQYAHYVFKTFKNGNTGTINFEDFLHSLSQASRGTVQEKLRWVFCLYDLNGDGYITKSEMTSVAAAIYDMLGRFTAPAVDDLSARQHVDTIFHKIDANQDGLITFEELSQWCTREERFIKSLDMLDTVL